MNLLWLSNISVSKPIKGSGTWIYSMFHNILEFPDIRITNITFGHTSEILKISKERYDEYIIPNHWFNNAVKSKRQIKKFISNLTDSEVFDLIHVWGIEVPWAIIVKPFKNIPQLIEIQGFKGITSLPIHYLGGLDHLPSNILGKFEFILPSISSKYTRRQFQRWEKWENLIISEADYIDTQSEWVRNVLTYEYNTHAKIYNTNIILRKEFLECQTWRNFEHSRNGITLFAVSAPIPYKGIHIAIEAVRLLKKTYPDIRLRVAGITNNRHYQIVSGYVRYLNKLINKYDLSSNIEFLGNIEAIQITEELQKCSVFVNTSFIETYCLALAEAMAVGVPSVSSYAAALPELAMGERGLTFPVGDAISCAASIDDLLKNNDTCLQLSKNAESIRDKYNPVEIVKKQIAIYNDIITDYNNVHIQG